MARTSQQRKFGKVAKAARRICIRDSSTVSAFDLCMSTEMKSGLGTKRKRKTTKKRKRR